MNNYQELIVFLLRSSNSIEFFVAGFLLYKLLRYIRQTPIYPTVKKVGFSLMFLGLIREVASVYDFIYGDNAGRFTLLINTIVYGYIILVLIRVLNLVRKTDYTTIKFNDAIDRMINDLSVAITKVENKSN